MTDRNPSHAPPLELPPAALTARTHIPPHIDSEEAVRYERRRVSLELGSYSHASSRPSSSNARESRNAPSSASLRSRNVSSQDLVNSSSLSQVSTQPDIPGASDVGTQRTRSSARTPRWFDPITNLWSTHVCPTLDEGSHRDHLALERTFLGYLRTSLILVMTGVLIAQLFRLQRSANPNPDFGFYVIGLPLSITFIGLAILVLLVGAARFWRHQSALIRGKALTGGWEVLTIMGLSALLLIATFALVLGVDIEKTYFGGD